MGVKTILGTAVGVTALALVVGSGTNLLDRARPRELMMAVEWSPSPRLPDGVNITMNVAGRQVVDIKLQRVSPFIRTYTVKPGDAFSITAYAAGEGIPTRLACTAAVNGVQAANKTAVKMDPRFVACQGVVA